MLAQAPGASEDARLAPIKDTGAAMLTVVTAIGVCVLAAWLVHCLARPRKFSLSGTPARPNRLGPFDILATILIWLGLQAGLISLTDPEKQTVWFAAGSIVIPVIWGSCCLLVGARAFRGGLTRGMGLSMRRWLTDSMRGLLGYLSLMPLCMGALKLAELVLPPEMVRPHPMLVSLGEVSLWMKMLLVVGAVVLAPLAEEVFFRGLLQSAIRARTRRPWAAILVASAFFALMHTSTPHALGGLFILAVGMGYNYERTGRLYPAILIHTIFNGVIVTAWLLNT